jgi:hypothetical protein
MSPFLAYPRDKGAEPPMTVINGMLRFPNRAPTLPET